MAAHLKRLIGIFRASGYLGLTFHDAVSIFRFRHSIIVL